MKADTPAPPAPLPPPKLVFVPVNRTVSVLPEAYANDRLLPDKRYHRRTLDSLDVGVVRTDGLTLVPAPGATPGMQCNVLASVDGVDVGFTVIITEPVVADRAVVTAWENYQ